MKVIPIALAPQYAAAGATLCVCLKITRPDASIVGFTSLDAKLTVDGVDYEPGFEPGEIVSSSDLSVDNLELTILPDLADDLLRSDLVAGLYDNSPFEIFEVNWKSPTDGVNLFRRGTTGEVTITRGAYVIELRGLKQALQQPVGAVTSKTCRARLGDVKCTLDLTPFTHDYATTAVASNRVFTCATATEVADYYGDGTATGLVGPNAGYERKVKSFGAGVVTLALPMPFAIGVGDTFRMVAGCRKRWDVDCRDKFDNILNFQGEKDVPGSDHMLADPDTGS